MKYNYATHNLDVAAYLLSKGYMPNRIRKHTFTSKNGTHKPSSEFTFEIPVHPDNILEEWDSSPEAHYVDCRVNLKRAISKLFKSSSSSIVIKKET